MAMPDSATLWTVEMVNALPEDGQRREIIDGELFVTPAPSLTHQRALSVLAYRLERFTSENRAGLMLFAPFDVTFSSRTNVQPDLIVLPLVDGRPPRSWKEAGRLLLCVEVLSSSTAHLDRGKKRRLYQREQVPEYWIADVDARVLERWRPQDARPEILDDVVTWQPEGAGEEFRLDLRELFDAVSS